ncbi:MAG: hypothetical protein HFACDABA_01903 [Anaerolineales bacterium]|nr:hypothetical protein [Anaerolineales bacterium]
MTTILFERTGGFMGRKVSLSLDLDALPSDQSEILRGLLETCDFFSLPESPSLPPVPDEFVYFITVVTDTVEHTIQTSDTGMDDSLRPLVEELGRLARKA